MSYFRKTTNEAGEEVFEEVDLSKEELPEAVVKAQKPFKEVLTQTIGRRKKIDELEAAIEAYKKPLEESETPDPVEQPKKVEAPANASVVDPETLFKDFEARLAQKQADAELQRKTEQENLAAILKEYGLKSDAVEILNESKDPRKVAEKLAKSAYRFDEQSSGDPDKKQMDSAVGGAFKRLGLED